MNEIFPIPFFGRFPVSCGTTTRHFPLKVDSTREFSGDPSFFELGERLLGLKPTGWVVAEQPHGDTVTFLDGAPSPSMVLQEGTDGLMTQHPDQILSILTADCLPIFFYLEDPRTAGLVHAGWRSTAKGIARKAVSALAHLSTGRPGKIHAAFGPSIRGCCYEVGEEFRDLFPSTLEERQGRFTLDLVKENRRQLLEAGLLPDHVGSADPCSACRLDSFYSYRREGKQACRMLSWIALKAGV